MAHRLVVLEWLYKADQDFGFAQTSLASKELTYFDQICFFFHQAAEKYLKAYIVKFDLKFAKLHDLVKLLEICSTHDPSLKFLDESCAYLTPFYFETRYADEIFAVLSREQSEIAHQYAKGIQTTIRQKLGIEGEITLEEIKKEDEQVDKVLKNPKTPLTKL